MLRFEPLGVGDEVWEVVHHTGRLHVRRPQRQVGQELTRLGRYDHTPLRRTEGEERDRVRYYEGSLAIFQIVQDNHWYYNSVYDQICWEGGTVRVFERYDHTPLRRTEGDERDGVRYHDGSLAMFQIVQDNHWYFNFVYDQICWKGGTVRVFGRYHHTILHRTEGEERDGEIS